MSSATITAYCTRDDLRQWLVSLMTTSDLLAFPMTLETADHTVVADPTQLVLTIDTFRIYLFPRSAMPDPLPRCIGEVESRRRGWISCDVGGVRDSDGIRVLTQSTISGEDFDFEEVHPARYVRSLKRRLAKSTKAGVRAVGTDVVYKPVRYTEAAVRLASEGVQWKYDLTSVPSFEPWDLGSE